jgi:hypothetical protein
VPIAKLAGFGVTAIAVMVFVAAVTVSVAVPLMPLSDAVMVVEPAVAPVAKPDEFTVATAVFEEFHVAVVVTFAVELSLYVAVAVYCSVAPTAMLAVAGVTEIAVTVFATAVTLSAAVPLTPPSDAVIVLEPAATPVAMPDEFTVATAVFEVVQVAVDVTFAVDPSL